MVRELSIATMQSKSFFAGMDLLKLNPAQIEKEMTQDAMGTIQRVLEKVNNPDGLPPRPCAAGRR